MSLFLAVALVAADPVIAPWDTEARLKNHEARLVALEGAKKAAPATCPCGPNCPCAKSTTTTTVIKTEGNVKDALDELNAQRAQRGLPPYRRSNALTKAAMKCAGLRAARRNHGHLNGGMSDFACLEPGTVCEATGAEAPGQNYPPGFWTCAMYDNYQSAGAARALDENGEQYMSLFVSSSAPQTTAVSATEPAPSPTWFYPANTTMVKDANGNLVPSKAPTEIIYPENPTVRVPLQAAQAPVQYMQPTFMGGGSCSNGSCSSGGCASGNCGQSRGRRR